MVRMFSLVYDEKTSFVIRKYIFEYKRYFHDLYSDTGIFTEYLILEKYEEEAKKRHREILDIIDDRLSPDVILGRTPDKTLFIPWRSKTLLITWEDE